jgi:membrane-associated protease RseP (regulator of RpoE activity)
VSAAAGIVGFVVIIFVMIVIHELGHFAAARSFGIKVEEFFMGFGPKLFARTRGETTYGIKAILLGGYVRIAGMNPWQTVPESDLPRTFGAKPAWQRAIVLVAGSATHFVLATVILIVAFGFVGIPRALPVLASYNRSSPGVEPPAQVAGLRPGDRVVAIDGTPIERWEEVRSYVQARPNQTVTIEVRREGRPMEIPVTLTETKVPGESRPVGYLGMVARTVSEQQPFPEAVVSAVKGTGELTVLSVQGIGRLFSPSGLARTFGSVTRSGERSIDEPIGLVGGARLAGQAAAAGRTLIMLNLLAGFVIFVGVINLAPLPPLDGGHLLVLGIEKVTRRQVDMRKVVPVAAFVISVFMALFVVILYQDILNPISNPFR